MAFAFSPLLCPHRHGQTLRPAVPQGERYGFTTFRLSSMSGQVPAIDRRVYGSRQRSYKPLYPPSVPFWLKRISHFRFFTMTIFIADSLIFHHADYLALIRLMATRKVLPSRFAPHTLRYFVTLSRPLLIQACRFIR